MNVIESRWRARQSRSENGIYFATDDFIELCGNPCKGYRADLRASIAALLQSTPDGWTDLEDVCTAQDAEFQLFAGSTSLEGAGFVAIEQNSNGGLVWLLHLTDAEPFIEISTDGSMIHAVSEQYPFRFEWEIPIHSPEDLAVTRISQA